MTTVWCTTEFEGFHNWPHAPVKVAFLRDVHRHLFKVRLELVVIDLDRQVEFITLKKALKTFCLEQFGTTATALSCEHMCVRIKDWVENWGSFKSKFGAQDLYLVTVSEDGENGATLYNDNKS